MENSLLGQKWKAHAVVLPALVFFLITLLGSQLDSKNMRRISHHAHGHVYMPKDVPSRP